eukprot:CAMPEP_0118921848 /NCGR_PEP_ID=MMETSP1169-20130426/995_1 /TAXON_ID=36882 /ORGANISM="Pyramimonas obovata, Strain CCMP722" /LENGTH=156 /DNA_ID=CAMNT_0006862639 /DNA_START=68 /DNA_END=536 /DNA_ORIENTATION=+
MCDDALKLIAGGHLEPAAHQDASAPASAAAADEQPGNEGTDISSSATIRAESKLLLCGNQHCTVSAVVRRSRPNHGIECAFYRGPRRPKRPSKAAVRARAPSGDGRLSLCLVIVPPWFQTPLRVGLVLCCTVPVTGALLARAPLCVAAASPHSHRR